MEEISVKQALLDLLYVDVHLLKVEKEYPQLNPVIQFIIDNKSLDEDGVSYLSIKNVAIETQLKYDTVRKQILKLYNLMLPFMEHPYLSFTKVKYELYFSNFNYRHYMLIDSFPVALRVGENLTMPFLKAKMQTDRFYVSSIRHSFIRETQLIEVELKGGDYNLFWNLRRDEAEEKRELPLMDFYGKEDYLLKKELLGR